MFPLWAILCQLSWFIAAKGRSFYIWVADWIGFIFRHQRPPSCAQGNIFLNLPPEVWPIIIEYATHYDPREERDDTVAHPDDRSCYLGRISPYATPQKSGQAYDECFAPLVYTYKKLLCMTFNHNSTLFDEVEHSLWKTIFFLEDHERRWLDIKADIRMLDHARWYSCRGFQCVSAVNAYLNDIGEALDKLLELFE